MSYVPLRGGGGLEVNMSFNGTVDMAIQDVLAGLGGLGSINGVVSECAKSGGIEDDLLFEWTSKCQASNSLHIPFHSHFTAQSIPFTLHCTFHSIHTSLHIPFHSHFTAHYHSIPYLQAIPLVTDPLYLNGSQYYIDLINATGAWKYTTGGSNFCVEPC